MMKNSKYIILNSHETYIKLGFPLTNMFLVVNPFEQAIPSLNIQPKYTVTKLLHNLCTRQLFVIEKGCEKFNCP